MFPPDKQTAAARALEAAFGVREADAVTRLVADDGLTQAFVYRVEVANQPYLLRFVKETMPGVDPAREFAMMRGAADAGVAPRVWHASVEDRVMIGDLVHARPYPPDAGPRLAAVLRRLHDMPGFAPTTNYMDVMDGFVERLAAGDMLPRATADELAAGYRAASAAYPRDPSTWVPCHHDLKPQNMLYDGERFWLIDWEAAFMDDRYADLAITANFVANTEADADAFLAAYFGRPPEARERARLLLMSVMVSAFYVAIFGGMAARAGAPWDAARDVPTFEAMNRRVVAGELDLEPAEAKRLYAHAHLSRALAAIRSPRFDEAVALTRGSP